MEETMDQSERLFDEVNPTSITKALSFFKWVRVVQSLPSIPYDHGSSRFHACLKPGYAPDDGGAHRTHLHGVECMQRPTATAREQHKVMPPWKPVPIVDSDELLALKTNLNAQFNDIAAGSLYALE